MRVMVGVLIFQKNFGNLEDIHSVQSASRAIVIPLAKAVWVDESLLAKIVAVEFATS